MGGQKGTAHQLAAGEGIDQCCGTQWQSLVQGDIQTASEHKKCVSSFKLRAV